jgi:hypothetical protein
VVASGPFRERLAVIVSRDSSGMFAGLMRSLDQGAQAPATISVRGDTFSFTIAAEHITYAGVWATTSGDTVRGTFTQNGHAFPLNFVRGAEDVALAARPQESFRPDLAAPNL